MLLYAAHNAANSLFAYPAGAVADRFGRRHVLVFGIGLFAVASLGFIGDSASIPLLALLFVLVGASTALVETGQGAYAAELLHDSIRGRGFGVLGLVDGIGDLVSSVVVGILFTVTDPAWGFVYAGRPRNPRRDRARRPRSTAQDRGFCDLNTSTRMSPSYPDLGRDRDGRQPAGERGRDRRWPSWTFAAVGIIAAAAIAFASQPG